MGQPPLFPTDRYKALTERQWQTILQEGLKREGWAFNHVFRSRMHDGSWRTTTTAVGFPDLVAFREEYVVAIEVKSAKGKVGPQQIEWLERFARIPTGRAWLLDPIHTPWQDIANWLNRPGDAPQRHGF